MASLDQHFQRPEFNIPRRLLLMVIGSVKTGKSTLGLSAVGLGPLAILDYDMGLEGPLAPFKGKEIWHLPLDAPTSMLLEQDITNDDYKRVWLRAKDAFLFAVRDPRIKTVVVDTASEMWEACRLAHFGKLTQVFPMNRYGEPNGDFRYLLRAANDQTNLNVILTHKMKDEYVNDHRTGRKTFAGFNDVPGWAQMVVEMWKREKTYGLTIIECRHKRALEGTELPAAIASFPTLLDLVHGPAPERNNAENRRRFSDPWGNSTGPAH